MFVPYHFVHKKKALLPPWGERAPSISKGDVSLVSLALSAIAFQDP